MERTRNRLAAVAAVWLAFALTACTSISDEHRPDGSSPPEDATPTPAGAAALSRAAIDALIQRASRDLGLGADAIRLVRAEAVTWSDGSIGCPQAGMAYTQALVPGFRVVLDVAGEEIHYHAASDGEFFRCDNPQEPISTDTVDR